MSEALPQKDLETLTLEELEGAASESLRVLVVRLSAMGDVIHALPAVASLNVSVADMIQSFLSSPITPANAQFSFGTS